MNDLKLSQAFFNDIVGSNFLTWRLEENKLTSWNYAHNRLNHRSVTFLSVVHQTCERKHFDFRKPATVALMFLINIPFL